MNRRLFLILPILITSIVNTVVAITRQQVVDNAKPYCNYIWSVITTNPRYPIYADSGNYIVGEAYSYGNKEIPSDFGSFITNLKLIPRNWEANWTAHPETREDYTGIDCSGLVTRCFNFSENLVQNTNASDLQNYTIPVNDSAKAGDIWWYTGHVVLQSEDEDRVYEANPDSSWDEVDKLGNRVQYHYNFHYTYQKRTIFPQFTAMTPTPDTTVDMARSVTISVKAEGTSPKTGVDSRIDNVLMWLDGNAVTPTVTLIKKRVYNRKATYKLVKPTPGKHRVKVQCANIVNGVAYEDTVAWEFRCGKSEWYECTEDINSDRAYRLVYDHTTTYGLYNWYGYAGEMPKPWTWIGKMTGVMSISSLKFAGSFGDYPFWITGNGDTFSGLWPGDQPVIEPLSTGGYSIAVDGHVVFEAIGQHIYTTNSFNYYYNDIHYPVARLNNLSFQKPAEVTISYTPPVWPSEVEVCSTDVWQYFGSTCWVFEIDRDTPQLAVYNEDTTLLGYSGRIPHRSLIKMSENPYSERTCNKTVLYYSTKIFPNPIKNIATIEYTLPSENQVALKVYNLTGQLVKTLVDERKTAGSYSCKWNGIDNKGYKVSAGIYIYKYSAGQYSDTKKMIWLK